MKKQYKPPTIIKKEKVRLVFAACNYDGMSMCAPGTPCTCSSFVNATMCSIGSPCTSPYI